MTSRLIATVLLFLAAGPAPIKLPADYREWIYLSSGLGMNYNPVPTAGAPLNFDNVFVKRESYRGFLKTGAWPDNTMFVLEARAADSKGSINRSGHFQTGVTAIDAEVKQNGKWTFYGFAGGGAEGKPFDRTASCYECHAKNAAVDNTFVQFYPTLLPIAKEKGTFRAGREE